ncbi:hypothetical protein NW759_016382 [Fusarium solani]|nr:hypothetical protein NW759_016382 [Fusarium solani]
MPPRFSQRRKRKARRRMLRCRSPPFLNLPVEVVILIMERLPDLTTLASAVETCRAMHNIFCMNSQLIVREILSKACDDVRHDRNPYQGVCGLIEDLEFAVRRQFLPRSPVEDAFTVTWSLFSEMEVEEILYPIARQLAWTYDRPQDAIKFLKAVRHHQKPYILPPSRRSSPALLPVARSLHHFFQYTNDEVQRQLAAKDIIHLAELQGHHTTFLWITSSDVRQSKRYMFTLFFLPQPPFILQSEPLTYGSNWPPWRLRMA